MITNSNDMFIQITSDDDLNSINGGGSITELIEAAIKVIRQDDSKKSQSAQGAYNDHR